ncbi:MAG: hypothetical protein B7O98_08285 [Zestosphaera tikiterensis]|uniref:Molybdopterin synthase sulfur carrier subunit n=1 Tax=Zestosphaera tikiterensis TaxID=1973259 RepID=A0A2R7Y2Q9_9CREN|nr:MAG: hypothetical protein B7O98_08285 [Zestosphaera tikiterensis]
MLRWVNLRLRLYGLLKDLAGREYFEFVVNAPTPIGKLINDLASKDVSFREFLEKVRKAEINVMFVVNDSIVGEDFLINDMDEVVLLPPAAGG